MTGSKIETKRRSGSLNLKSSKEIDMLSTILKWFKGEDTVDKVIKEG